MQSLSFDHVANNILKNGGATKWKNSVSWMTVLMWTALGGCTRDNELCSLSGQIAAFLWQEFISLHLDRYYLLNLRLAAHSIDNHSVEGWFSKWGSQGSRAAIAMLVNFLEIQNLWIRNLGVRLGRQYLNTFFRLFWSRLKSKNHCEEGRGV